MMEIVNKFVPDKLHVENFNNITDLELELNDILVITGKNGTGKTSIAEAIDFCLTGQIMRPVSINDITTGGENITAITIEGEYNDKYIKITRKRRGKSTKVKVIIGSGSEMVEISNPNDFLDGIITQTEFEKLYYLNGHDINTFVSGTTGKTSEMLDKLFSINKLNIIVKELSRGILEIDKKTTVLKASVETLEKKKEIVTSVAASGNERSILEREMNRITSELPRLAERRKELEKERSDLNGELSQLRETASNHSRILQEMETLKNEKNFILEKMDDISKRKGEINALMKEMNVEEGDFGEDLDSEINDLKAEVLVLEKEVDFWKDIPSLVGKILNQSPDSNDCPMCLTENKKEAAVANMNKMNESKKTRLKETLVKKIDLKKRIEKLEGERNTWKMMRINKMEMETRFSAFQNLLDEKNNKIEGIDLPPEETVKETSKNVEEKSKKVLDMGKEILKIDTVIQQHEENLNRMGGEMESLINPSISWGDEDEKELAEKNDERNALIGKKEILLDLKSGFKIILSNIREQVMNLINPNIIEYIKKFGINKTPITRFEIVPKVSTRGAESYYYYDFKVEVDGVELPFNALSTGQRALSLISIILNMINFSSSALLLLIFDEIDNCGLDKENINIILKSIVNLSKKMKILFINRDEETIGEIVNAGKEKNIDIPVHEMKFQRNAD